MPKITLQEVINFIRANGVFEKWTDTQILMYLDDSIKSCALAFTRDREGKLNGICFGKWENDAESFHVACLIGELKPFVKYLTQTFPQCKQVTGIRQAELMKYSVAQHLA